MKELKSLDSLVREGVPLCGTKKFFVFYDNFPRAYINKHRPELYDCKNNDDVAIFYNKMYEVGIRYIKIYKDKF